MESFSELALVLKSQLSMGVNEYLFGRHGVVRAVKEFLVSFLFNFFYGFKEKCVVPAVRREILLLPAVELAKKIRNKEVGYPRVNSTLAAFTDLTLP